MGFESQAPFTCDTALANITNERTRRSYQVLYYGLMALLQRVLEAANQRSPAHHCDVRCQLAAINPNDDVALLS